MKYKIPRQKQIKARIKLFGWTIWIIDNTYGKKQAIGYCSFHRKNHGNLNPHCVVKGRD